MVHSTTRALVHSTSSYSNRYYIDACDTLYIKARALGKTDCLEQRQVLLNLSLWILFRGVAVELFHRFPGPVSLRSAVAKALIIRRWIPSKRNPIRNRSQRCAKP